MTVAGDPNRQIGKRDNLDGASDWIANRPLVHFVVSELLAGLASISVYAFFVIVSYATEHLTASFPLQYQAPAKFLDLVLAWAAALSGALTFSLITFCSIVRLGVHLLRGIKQ